MQISANHYRRPDHSHAHRHDREVRDHSPEQTQIDIVQQHHHGARKCTNHGFVVAIILTVILFAFVLALLLLNFCSVQLPELSDSISYDIPNFGMRERTQPIQGLSLITRSAQLPFCLLLVEDQYTVQQIKQSIDALEYTNFTTIDVATTGKDEESMYHPFAYARLHNILSNSKCGKNSLLMFVNQPLLPASLAYLNEQFQTYHIWATLVTNNESQTQSTSYELVGFYMRIYDLILINDFNQSNNKYFNFPGGQFASQAGKRIAAEVQMLGIMEMTANHFKYVERYKIFKQNRKPSFFNFNPASLPSQLRDRTKYKKLTKLSQDYDTNIEKQLRDAYSFSKGPFHRINQRGSGLSKLDLQAAIERMQIPYLPQGHNIIEIEKLKFEQRYQIGKYSAELPFCVTILSRNNIEHGRYWKVVDSVLQQEYSNYHIVFIDDKSTDSTLDETMRYFRSQQFPSNRIAFVQNKKHMFATYNIINAAYRHCQSDDIQMLVDGDDQLIGRHVFSLFNAAYQSIEKQQNRSAWYVYSSYKDSFYRFGYSAKIVNQNFGHSQGRREKGLVVGAIRTWRVKLIYQIPLPYHQMEGGRWLDTMYDDALSYSLIELSTTQRVHYLPEILYEYNRGYGDNDDSSIAKLNHRYQVFQSVLRMPKLQALTQTQLDSSQRDQQIVAILERDEGVNYQVIKL